MTQLDRPTPWPRTWPPFWRDVLHVAIAAGAANIFGAILDTALIAYRVRLYLWLDRWPTAWMISWLLQRVLPPVLIVAFFSRMKRRTIIALVIAFTVGYLPVGLAVLHIFLDSPIRMHLVFIDISLAIFALSGFVFVLMCRQVSVRRTIITCVLGAVLFSASILWMEIYLCRQFDTYTRVVSGWAGIYVYRFVKGVSTYGPISLTFAITAKLLLRAAEGETKTGKES